jgi:hypothetical protein
MSAQCFCYDCAGAIVCRKTYYNHGRMDKPLSPVPLSSEVLGFDDEDYSGMPALYSDSEGYSSSDDDGWDEDEDDSSDDGEDSRLPQEPANADEEEADDKKFTGRGKMTRSEIVMCVLDWIACRKVTDVAASTVWDILTLLIPEETSVVTWGQIKRSLRAAEQDSVVRIDMCVNDCIAFWNSSSLPESYRHAHRSKCPVCFEDRWIKDPVDGKERSRKVLSHIHAHIH